LSFATFNKSLFHTEADEQTITNSKEGRKEGRKENDRTKHAILPQPPRGAHVGLTDRGVHDNSLFKQ
jgi:hypothetical protein